ncbi:unnamed protein product [Cyprideis torosa]|uniref:Uncharacterized protein n=1 Tax=Cyprideis torosa TaxID=163714 RepID=A0A7R8ZQH2_9CRUS|nr:unnamed protein product [Cyprideis torosa]CAG0896380.1 unnamed protein product [Cyprideis torosa]
MSPCTPNCDSFQCRRRKTFTLGFVSNFLGGSGYGIIFPTVWFYLESLGTTSAFYLGLVNSAFSVAGLVSGLLVGVWADNTENTRLIILSLNCFQIVGDILYFIGVNVWVIFIGRLLGGIGVGMNSCIYSEVSRATTAKERTPILTGIVLVRQVAILMSPAYNFFLRDVNFSLFGLPVNQENVPGLVQAIWWILFEIAVVFLFYNVGKEYRELQEELQRVSPHFPSSSSDSSFSSSESDEKALLKQEKTPLLSTSYSPKSLSSLPECYSPRPRTGTVSSWNCTLSAPQMEQQKGLARVYFEEFTRPQILTLLWQLVVAFFLQSLIETFIPPLLEVYFNLGSSQNSFLYAGIGGEAMLVYLTIIPVSKYVPERYLLGVAALAGAEYLFPYFVGCCVIAFISTPIVSACNVGLISKLLSRRVQGMGQGIRRSMIFLGLILGPIWSGVALQNPVYMFSLAFAICLSQACQNALVYEHYNEHHHPRQYGEKPTG